MENLEIQNEIFNILKGSNYNVILYTADGSRADDPSEATRFYCTDADLMVSLRIEDSKLELLMQTGQGFDVTENKDLVKILKNVAHKNLGEFTVKRFNKKIEPKDFAHQSIKESKAFSKAFGSVKTSYMQLEGAKLIIKHTKAVNEEVRGSRSRNIHSLFIENANGEKFSFPYKYMAGAKAMARHVAEGGTPYDQKGENILDLCEEISSLNKFLKHVKGKGLVNETNDDAVQAVRAKLDEYKSQINRLHTSKGYNSFTVAERNQEDDQSSDIASRFLLNTFGEDMDGVLEKVSRIVQTHEAKTSLEKETLVDFYKLFQDSNKDLNISFDKNDPEHPANHDPKKWSGSQGALAYTAQLLEFLSLKTKNDAAANYMMKLGTMIHNMEPAHQQVVVKLATYLDKTANAAPAMAETFVDLEEAVMQNLRKKIG